MNHKETTNMTKKILLAMAFVASVISCTDDYKDWAEPQKVDQPEIVSFGDGSISTVGVIDFNSVADEAVKVCNITAPTATNASYTPSFTIQLGDNSYDISADGYMSAADLQDYVINLYGRRPVERAVEATVSMWLSNGTTTVKTATSDVFHINVIPQAPQISENYYIVGGASGDWAGTAASKELKFTHSGKDVYEDPIFTITMPASADGDTWFAIGDDEACDAIANNNDWSKLFGTKKGNGNTDPTGNLDRRYNLSDDGSFCVPAGSRLIKVTINMMDYTYQIEALNIAENYYLIGGPGEWSSDRSQKFSHSDKSVFDDPVFTYTFASTGGEMWFAFGDDEAFDGVASGDWTKLFGTTGASEDLKGTFDRRYNLGGDHSFHVDGAAKYYRMTINMMTYEYEITPINFEPFIYFIGATDGWANAEQKLASPNNDGIYTGYLYIADPNGWGNEYKFQKVPGDWDSQVNCEMMTGGMTGDVEEGGGGNFKANAGEAVYYVTLNLADMSINAVKVEKMGIIGDFNSWGGDVEMTWDAENFCFVATNPGVNGNGWKFRINSDWAINLGGNDSVEPSMVIDDLVANGKNLGAVGTTIKLYPTRKTSDKIYCTVE